MQIINHVLVKVDETDIHDGYVAIPAEVTSIGVKAFARCTTLSHITIPASVTSIGDGAFFVCSRLSHITIPAGVMSIGDWAFAECPSLSHITIPDSVMSIGFYAFQNCTSLSHITIPDRVMSIGLYAFQNCTSLSHKDAIIHITATNQQTFQRVLGLLPSHLKQQVETNCQAFIKAAKTLLCAYQDRTSFFSNNDVPLDVTSKLLSVLATRYGLPECMVAQLTTKTLSHILEVLEDSLTAQQVMSP